MTSPVLAPAPETTTAERRTESRRRADRARAAVRTQASEAEPESAAAPTMNYSVGDMATTPPPEAEATSEQGAPEEVPELPPAPEPGVSAEQVAERQEQITAAQASLDSAQDSPGLMTAFATAPPTVKAQVSGQLGQRLDSTLGQETTAIAETTPPVSAEMQGNAPAPAGTIEAPAVTDITLETAPPEAVPAPDAVVGEPVATEGDYSANADVSSQLQRSFNPESGAAAVESALDSVQTSDPSIATSAGSPPPIPQEGETDPQRFQNQREEGARQADETLAQQQAAAQTLPGAAERTQLADVHESHDVGELAAPTAEQAPAPEGAQQYLGLEQPPEVQTAFDGIAGAQMQESMAEAQSQVDTAAQERDTQHQAEVAQAEEQTAEAQRQAGTDQRAQVAAAQSTVETERQSTLEHQQSAVQGMQTEADTRREADRGQFDDRVQADQEQIDGQYDQAEIDAATEVQSGERDAEAERARRREAEDQSWWEAALDFITDLFDALVAAINTIFDAVRAAVNALLDAVRDFAIGLIRLAADFLKGLIEAYGEFLKGLVQALLADIFPELAQALVAAIDAAVELANRAIDAVADVLIAAVNAIVEALRRGIMALINAYQAAVNAALALARAALTGDWSAFLLQLLEAACRVAGIDPQSIYDLIGRAQETIQIIVDNPGQFLSNLLDALLGGFRRFADNFLTHLQAGIIGWLTGAIGGAGIILPERFDLLGVISLVAQVLGLTWPNLRERIVRFVGERGVQVLEFVASYVQTLITGGWAGLWERIQSDMATLRDMVLTQIRNFLVERIIIAAVTRLATMFNPVGALVNILIAAYNFYTFIRDQLQRIMQIVTTIVDAVSNIAHGQLGPAQEGIERFLAGLLPLAIDLLARLIGLGNVSERVREILTSVQQTIWGAIDRLIERVVGMFRGGAPAGVEGAPAAAGEGDAASTQIGQRLTIPGTAHHLYIRSDVSSATVYVQSTESVLQAFLASPPVEVLRDENVGRGYVDTARRQIGVVNTEANQVLALARRDPNQQRIAAENTEVTRQEQELVVSLQWIFRRLEMTGEAVELSQNVVLDSINTQDRRTDGLLEVAAFDPESMGNQLALLRLVRTRLERLRGEVRQPNVTREQLQQRQNDLDAIREEIDGYDRDPNIQDARVRLDALRRGLQAEALSNVQWGRIVAEVARILTLFRDEIMSAVPATRIGFRGSLARGWKGPQKVTPSGAAQRFDPTDFDCDAYIEVTLSLWMQEIEPVLPVHDQRQTRKFRTLEELSGWSRARQVTAVEARIATEIETIGGILRGFRIDAATGRPAFHFFIQSPDATLDLQLQAAGYRPGAFEQAGASGIEIVLSVRGGLLRYPQTVIEV